MQYLFLHPIVYAERWPGSVMTSRLVNLVARWFRGEFASRFVHLTEIPKIIVLKKGVVI